MPPKRSQVWTSSRRQRRRKIGKRSTQAQRSAIMFHVKPGVCCAQRPVSVPQSRPLRTHPSPIHQFIVCRERARGGPEARRRSRSVQRCDDEGRAAVTRRHRRAGVRRAGRESAFIVGTGRCQRRDRRRDNSDTHRHPPPSSICFPWFHVKLAVGRSLTRFLRIRASAS